MNFFVKQFNLNLTMTVSDFRNRFSFSGGNLSFNNDSYGTYIDDLEYLGPLPAYGLPAVHP